MSSSRCTHFLRPITRPLRRTYSRKLPHNYFSLIGMSSAAGAALSISATPFPAQTYQPSYDTWPYNEDDFTRYDETDDAGFYRQPRLVTHIDDASIARLTDYYNTVLPTKGRILDMCTSWKSFYPSAHKVAVQSKELEVFGVGLNAAEMELNGLFQDSEHWRVLDLNKAPYDVRAGWPGLKDKGQGELKFDAVTCVVSIDYLIKPRDVCRSLLAATKEGGMVHLVVSNRCFPNKVVRRWMMLSEKGRLELVGDYLHFSGWKDVEIVDLCARNESGMRITDDHGAVLSRWSGLPGHLDPLWVVRGTKRSDS